MLFQITLEKDALLSAIINNQSAPNVETRLTPEGKFVTVTPGQIYPASVYPDSVLIPIPALTPEGSGADSDRMVDFINDCRPDSVRLREEWETAREFLDAVTNDGSWETAYEELDEAELEHAKYLLYEWVDGMATGEYETGNGREPAIHWNGTEEVQIQCEITLLPLQGEGVKEQSFHISRTETV